ncbi:MAG: hypothetical protein RMZ95_024715 [Nostoc sp. DedQUE07]
MLSAKCQVLSADAELLFSSMPHAPSPIPNASVLYCLKRRQTPLRRYGSP